jgi:hypothetical protein
LQDRVAILGQLVNRAGLNLFTNALDDGGAKLRRQLRCAEHLPPGRHRPGELLEEMLDTAQLAPMTPVPMMATRRMS